MCKDFLKIETSNFWYILKMQLTTLPSSGARSRNRVTKTMERGIEPMNMCDFMGVEGEDLLKE